MGRMERLRTQLEELRSRRNAERDELLGLAESADELSDAQESRWMELAPRWVARDGGGPAVWAEDELIDSVEAELRTLEAIVASPPAARVAVPAPTSSTRTGRGPEVIVRPGEADIFGVDVRSISGVQLRDVAERVADDRLGSGGEERSAIERMLRRVNNADNLRRHMVVTERPEYRSAFSKFLANGQYAAYTGPEAEALAEARAMSLTDANGGYGVPFTLDPTVIDTGTHNIGPWRDIATVISTTTDNWQGVSSTGMTASMVGEATEATDGSPTFAQPAIGIKKAHAFAAMSLEIDADYGGDLAGEVRDMFARAKGDLEDAQFSVGSGSGNNVEGLVTGLVSGSATVTSTTTDTFAVADLYKVENALQQRAAARAVWVGNKTTFNLVRAFGSSDSHALWVRLADGQPERLIGYAHHESPNMDGTINASAENYMLVLGDVAGTYKIVDRIGMSVLPTGLLMGTTANFPTGQTGLYCYFRFGAGVVNASLSKLLNVT